MSDVPEEHAAVADALWQNLRRGGGIEDLIRRHPFDPEDTDVQRLVKDAFVVGILGLLEANIGVNVEKGTLKAPAPGRMRRLECMGESWFSENDIHRAMKDDSLIIVAAATIKAAKDNGVSPVDMLRVGIAAFFLEATGLMEEEMNK
jgi:hypothetical protein